MDLTNQPREILSGNDNIVIVDNFQSIRGGRTLDVEGYPYEVLHAGHVIIQKTATKEYKPMPITGDGSVAKLGTLTAGTLYTKGKYTGVALTGGTGSGAKATIEVDNDGKVSSVTITTDGKGYAVGNELSAAAANIGGTGSGFKVEVSEVTTEKDEYASLPADHTIKGILIASIPTSRAFAGIMVRGTVNVNAMPFGLAENATLLGSVQTALPLVEFTHDKA